MTDLAKPPRARKSIDVRVDATKPERAHAYVISLHCPNCNEMEMAARVDLAILRDRCGDAAGRACESAGILLAEINRLAAQAVYAPVPASKLIRIRSALWLSFEAAIALERVCTT